MMPSLEVVVPIYFYDTDAGGVVHNVAYLRMIETARTDFAAQLGWSVAEMMSGGEHGCPVVSRTEIDYLKPARLGDNLVITVVLERVERVRFWLAFEVRRQSDGAPICRARQILVPVDMEKGRPVPLRGDWRAKWGS